MALARCSARCRTPSAAGSTRKVAVARPCTGVEGLSRAACRATAAKRRALVVPSARSGGGSGLLDNDTIVSPGKSTEGAKKKPPIYKVMLHNDNYNRREYVVKVLLKVVEGMTVDDAVVVMQEAHESGVALVVACAQDQAESYVEDLRLNGLISTMEPGH